MRRIFDIPLIVILIGIGSVSMLIPAMHAYALRNLPEARVFFYGAVLFSIFTVLLGLATATIKPRRVARSQLISLLGAYVILPVIFAVPFREAVQDTSFFNAWFEMLSCLTTTGMTLYDDPERLSLSLHLWRALIGWLGGLFIWVSAVALLSPMNLGGFEVLSDRSVGQGAVVPGAPGFRPKEASTRLLQAVISLLPIYLLLTVVLWISLILTGSTATVSLIYAMSTLSTSGISVPGGLGGAGTGIIGEAVILVFFLFALTRFAFAEFMQLGYFSKLAKDHELRLGLLIVVSISALLILRHWLGAVEMGDEVEPWLVLRALWGAVFTVSSFLTTTGFVSADWANAQNWSGLETPGMLLMGLAVLGGGVATTAGGVKLLRVWALYLHSRRELERLVHPSSIGGAGNSKRHLRRQGAEIAWIFFMLFAISLALITGGLTFAGIGFETAMVLSISALSTTGPIIEIGANTAIDLPSFATGAKAVLMAAMVFGRLETLAIIALLNPEFWRN